MNDPRAEHILDIVAKETMVDRDRLGMDVPMDTLGIPSLDMVQAIFALETEYGIELPVAESQTSSEFATVGDLVRHVAATIDAQAAATAAGDVAANDVAPGPANSTLIS